MAIENNYFSQFLNEENANKANLETEINQLKTRSNILELVEQKKVELGLKAEEKKTDFVDSDYASRTVNLGENFDGDTLYEFGRLSSGDGNPEGFSFDTFETAKYDGDGVLIPYLGSVDPKDGGKRSKKFNLHRTAYGKLHGIPAHMVSQTMLNEAGAKQAEAFKAALYAGQDPNSESVTADIRKDGVGYFGRPLITVRNPETGEIINEVMNTPENNAMFYSKYNQKTYSDGVIALSNAQRSFSKSVGEGFWDSMGKGISSGIDNLQATGYGFAALIVDATGKEELGTWFLDQYLRNIQEAQANGASLPGIEDVDWSNPTQVLSKLGSLIGEAMPSIALMIGTGGFAGMIAKGAATRGVAKFGADKVMSKGAQKIINKAANRGRGVGAYGAAMGMETGSIYGNVTEEGENRDFKGIAGSLAGGTIAGALEAFYPLKLLRKLGMGKGGSKVLKQSLLKNSAGQNLKNIGKELLSGGLTEGTTEGMQFIVEEVTQDLIKEGHLPDYKSKEFQLGLLNSIVAGLVPGATFSGTMSTVSEINNRIGGDRAALQRNLQQVQQEALDARDEAGVGQADIETEKLLNTRIETIQSQAKDLGIELSEDFQGLANIDKAIFLSDALNKLEIEQKDLPAAERNANVKKAKETINTALDNLNTGSARNETAVKRTVIIKDRDAKIDKIKSRFERLKKKFPQRTERYEAQEAKQIAKVTQIATNKTNKIDSKARRVGGVGTKVIRTSINKAVNQIKKINAQLKNPNISTSKRKLLERTRNQLGIKIDRLSKDSTGQAIKIPKKESSRIDSALNSFNFKNKRVKTKTNKELGETLVKARNIFKEYTNLKLNKEVGVEEFEGKKQEVIGSYKKIVEILASLVQDRSNTTDPDALKELDLQIADLQVMKGQIESEFKKEQKDKPKYVFNINSIPVKERYSKKGKLDPKGLYDETGVLHSERDAEARSSANTQSNSETQNEKLNSLNIDTLNEGVNEDILGSLNKAQKKSVKLRNKVKDSFKELKTKVTKKLAEVHKEIMEGGEGFKGLNQYLLDAKEGNFEETQFDKFVNGLEAKYKAFVEAKKIFDSRKSQEDVYVDKTTYKVYRNRKDIPKGTGTNYWYVNNKSIPLINLLQAEIAYAKTIKAVIADVIANVDSTVKSNELNAQIIANQKEIDRLLSKAQGNKGSLDDVNKPKNKPKTKPKSKPNEDSNKEYITVYDPNGKEYRVEVTARSKAGGIKILSPQTNKEIILGTSYSVENPLEINYTINSRQFNGKNKKVSELTDKELARFIADYTKTIKNNENARNSGQDGLWNQVRDLQAAKAESKRRKSKSSDTNSATNEEIEAIILEAEEIIDNDVDIDELIKPKEQTRANRNKRLKAYQDRVLNLIKKLSAEKDSLVEILKIKPEKGVNRAPLNRVEIQDRIDALNLKIINHKLELKNFIAADLKQKAGNHFLTKFKNVFTKLRDTVLTVTDLFRIKDIERDSFFSKNENKNLDKESILVLLEKVGVDPKSDYAKALITQFAEFKTAIEKVNVGFDDKRDTAEGLYAKEAFKLFLDKEGNIPDEVIFAMMLSTMHYASVNVGKSNFRAQFEIADLLYGDAKQTSRLGKAEINTWTNAGIFTKNASKDIGLEMLDLLNMELQKDSEKEFLKNIGKINSRYADDSTFRGVVLRDSNLRNQSAISLGLLALETARFVNTKKGKDGTGLFRLRRGSYPASQFDNPSLEYLSELSNKAEELGKEQFIEWNTININDSDLLKVFQENTEQLEKIKGAESNLSDISFKVIKTVQEKTQNSFFVLNKKIIKLIDKLQQVQWIGKGAELDLFNLLVTFDKDGKLAKDEDGKLILNDTLKKLIGYKNLNEQHSENKDAIESANEEKLKDIEYVIDYYNNKDTKGLKGFYFRYKAQTQHRLRIDSSTINPQRSKIMRGLFNPVGSESTVTTESDRAMFKLAIVQAFGHNIKTLEEGIEIFDQIYGTIVVREAMKATPENFINVLDFVLEEKITVNKKEINLVGSPSTHVLEAITALKAYSPTEAFTTTIGVETDGITNGYAIGLLQFLDGTPEELKEALERIGVFVDQDDAINTYEKFIASGKDDVYQAFSRKIVNAIKALDSKQQDAVEILHGELLEGDNALTKFARDLAKNPVMISNYGAGVTKVVNAIIGKIVPDMYDTLAKHQTAYNKATTGAEKLLITAEIARIQNTLENSIGINVDLISRLENNKLYDFKFNSNRILKIEEYFENIYQGENKIVGNALDVLLKPIKESREILTKVVEAEFFIFYSEFLKQTADFPKGKMTNVAIRMHIAAELADKIMPRMNSPWSDSKNENELIQLIKQVDAIGGRVTVRTKKIKNVIYKKEGKKWVPLRFEEEVSISASNTASDFATPGVAAVINMIQNMDSVVLGDLLDQKQQVLPIYDAVISPIKDALANAKKYNESFLKRNLEHVMLEQALKEYDKVIKNSKEFGIDLEQIGEDLKTKSYRGKQIVAELQDIKEQLADKEPRIKKLQNKKNITIKQTNILAAYTAQVTKLKENQSNLKIEQEGLTIEGIRESLLNKIESRKENLAALIELYGPVDTWVVSQMYLPESILNPELAPAIKPKAVKKVVKKIKTGLKGNSLTLETIDGFKGAQDAAIKLSKAKGETAYVRRLAKLLIPLLDDKIVVSRDFDKYGRSSPEDILTGNRSYSQKSNEALRPDVILIEPLATTTVLLHELIHAASQRILRTDAKDRTKRQNDAVNEMWKIREKIKTVYEKDKGNREKISKKEDSAINYLLYGGIEGWDISQINARKNMAAGFGNPEGLRDSEALAEFLTQTLTDPDAQAYLKRQKIATNEKVTGPTLWTRLVKSIRKLLSIKDDSLLSEALTISIEGIEALKEDDQKSQGDLFDNSEKIPDIKFAEDLNELMEAFEKDLDVKDNDVIEDDKLSSINNLVDDDLKEIYQTNSLRENLQSIFETLGISSREAYLNKGDKQVQESHLERVLTDIIAKAGVILDDTTVTLNESNIKAHGEANIGERSVDVNFNKFKPESYSEQTAQEVYVHELLHIITRFALKNNSRLRQKLERIRSEVKTEIEKSDKPYELFLRKDADGNIIYLTDKQAEIEAAQAQYNYLFGDAVPADAVLDEFLAYSLSNKFLVEKLNNMESKVMPLWSKEANESVVTKIVQFFTEILERMSNTLKGKSRPLNLEQEIFELTRDIVAVNQSKRDELARALKFNKISGAIDQGNSVIQKFAADVASGAIKKGSDAYIKAVDKITRDGKIKGFFADVLYDSKLIAYFGSSYKDFVDNHPKVQERLNVVYRNFKPNTLKNLSSLKSDLFGGVNQDFIKLLYRSHNEVDSNRREYKELTKESLQKVFKDYDSLTNPEKEGLTKVFLKTDLSILVESGEFTVEQVIELIQDDTKLTDLINDYESANKLNINNNNHYRIQTSQLAQIMMTGKNNSHNQMLNATNIYLKGPKKGRTYGKARKDEEIRDLDIYISLLALNDLNITNAKNDVKNVIEREFTADPTHNGIHGLINLHRAFKTQSLEEGFNSNPTLMTKGYIATVTDPDVQITVEPDDAATRKEMLRRGYEFVSLVDGIGATPWAMYVIKNNPELTRTKGIISMTSKQFKGTSLKEIFSRNQDTAKGIMNNLNKFEKAQTDRANKGQLSPKFTAIPVVDEKLNIVDYRITLSHALSEKHLNQELSFDEVLPTMYSQLEDKINSEKINEEGIKLLYRYGKENRKNNPSKFVNILDKRFEEEYYQPLPRSAKFQIAKFATIDKKTGKEEFWVERGYLDTVFGYVNPSVSNLNLFNKTPKMQRYAKVTEKLVKEMVSLAVVNVVIKIPIVPAVNFASNFVTSMLYGVPPTYLIKKWREGIVELNKYKKDAKTLKLLDIEILSNPSLKTDEKTKKKRKILVNRVNENPVARFVDAGLFTSITEDINQNEFTYRNKAFNKIKNVGNKLVTGKVFDVANHAYLGEHTAIFKASMQFLQMSDFIARYALYKHQTEVKGVNEDKAWKTMVETFVNYDQPLNRFVAYGNDMGAILFVKYWLRIQRAGINLIKEKPLNVGLFWASTGLLGMDVETILDSNLLTGNFMPTLGGFEKIFEEVLIPPGLEILAGEGFS